MPTQLQALEAFAGTEQNPDLLRLESLLKRFNLFEAVGAVRHELRHSDFLAFLLDPSRNHSLGSVFLSELLYAIRQTAEDNSILAALDLDGLDFSRAYVLREWHHIDILVVDDASRLAVIIENKIDTDEHSDQLNRYQKELRSHYPGYHAIGLFLTPDGAAPSSSDYQAISYTLVCEIIEKMARDNRVMLDAEVVMALEHYAQMLRRHIVSDSDVAELCRSIYKQHKQTLDLIFEHRPDQQAQIADYVQSLIQQASTLYLGGVAKNWTTFGLNEWSKAPLITSSPYFVYFEFHHLPYELKIYCTLSPGNRELPSNQSDREKLFRMARKHQFAGCQPRLNKNHCRLSIIQVLRADDYEKAQEEIEAVISEKWAAFLGSELPRMAQAIREEKWLWELP